RRRADLIKQQALLIEKQYELVRQMAAVKVRMPDLAAELQKLTQHLKEGERLNDVRTQQRVSDLQAGKTEAQTQLARSEGAGGREQSRIALLQSELGRQQSELGVQQSLLGQEQGRRAIEASKKVRQLLERALSDGLAKPEP